MTTPTKKTEETGSKIDKYEPPGVNFKAKMIGIEDVVEARGDKMCLESMGKLKAMVKESKEHKQKIVINVSLEGIKVIDERTLGLNHTHEVHKISFISRDPTDRRAFGYVYGDEGNHKFYAIKTAQQADLLVLSLKELFEAVLELKQQQMSVQKQKIEETTVYLQSSYDEPAGEATQKKVENGGVVQEQIIAEATDNALYAVPHQDREGDKQRALSSLVDLEKEVKTIQEGISTMSDFDLQFNALPAKNADSAAGDNPFNAGDPFSPAANTTSPARSPQPPATSASQDLFSVQAAPPSNQTSSTKSSVDLFAEFSDTFTGPTSQPARTAPSLPMPTQPPPPNPFGAGFGAAPAGGFGAAPAGGFGGGFGVGGFGQQPAPGAFGGGYQQPAPAAFQSTWGPPQPQAQPQLGGFGAPPPAAQPAADPFAGGFSGGSDFDAFTLQPQATAPPPGKSGGVTAKADPFGDIGVLGTKTVDTSSKKSKDPFAGFKMAKPGEVGVPDLKPQGQQKPIGNLNFTLDIAATHDSSPEEFSLPSPQMPPPPLPSNVELQIDSIEDSVEVEDIPPPPPPRPRNSLILKDSITPPPITPRSNIGTAPLPIPSRHRPSSATSTLSSGSQFDTDSSTTRGPPSTTSSSSLSSPTPCMSRNPNSCPSKIVAYSPLLENTEIFMNGNNHAANVNSSQSESTGDLHRNRTSSSLSQDSSQSQSKSSPLSSQGNHNNENCSNKLSSSVSPSPVSYRNMYSLSPNSAMDGLYDAASLLSSSAPVTNNSFHVNAHTHLSLSSSNPSINEPATPVVPVLPKHVDPFADDPFQAEDSSSSSSSTKPVIFNDNSANVVATSSQNWADFSSSENNRTSCVKPNTSLTNVSPDAWTDPFGAPADQKKGLTTSDGQPLFDSSPFGDFDFAAK